MAEVAEESEHVWSSKPRTAEDLSTCEQAIESGCVGQLVRKEPDPDRRVDDHHQTTESPAGGAASRRRRTSAARNSVPRSARSRS